MEGHVIGGRKEDVKLIAKEEGKSSPHSTKDFLRTTKVSSLFPENRSQIITIDNDEPCAKGFKLLIDHAILSVPVRDDRHRRYVGFLDMLDIVSFIAELSQDKTVDESASKQIQSIDKLNKVTCGEVVGKSGRNPWYPVEENAPLLQAMQTMVDHKIHRIPVINSSGDLETIITQSHVVNFISKRIAQFPIASKTIKELQLGYTDVVTVTKNQKAIDAFQLIYSKKVSGVAVVDENGDIFGNISASDIRYIESDASGFRRLFSTTAEFIEKIPKREGQIPGALYVRPESTVEEAIMKVVVVRAHRIYVVDDLGGNKRPIGVISLSDIIATVLQGL